MPLTPQTRLGPYEVLAAIGAGGMGEVYRARDTRLDRAVAIKVLPSHIADDAAARQRFEREILCEALVGRGGTWNRDGDIVFAPIPSGPLLRRPFLVIPEVSSERRDYVPIGWLKPPVIPSNLVRVLLDADLWHFGVLTSTMHMAWLRQIGGSAGKSLQVLNRNRV